MNEIGIMPTANWGGKERFEPASLRAEVTRLEAENERMRNAINETLYGPGDWREFEFTENRDVIVPQEILSKWVNILQSALSPSTDENEEADD